MKVDFKIIEINGKEICIGGVGKLFYQYGFPISMSVSELNKRGVEVSLFHVADECMKNGWSAETTIKKLKEDFIDGGAEFNEGSLFQFCVSSYEDQREMIYNYLFASKEDSIKFVRNLLS